MANICINGAYYSTVEELTNELRNSSSKECSDIYKELFEIHQKKKQTLETFFDNYPIASGTDLQSFVKEIGSLLGIERSIDISNFFEITKISFPENTKLSLHQLGQKFFHVDTYSIAALKANIKIKIDYKICQQFNGQLPIEIRDENGKQLPVLDKNNSYIDFAQICSGIFECEIKNKVKILSSENAKLQIYVGGTLVAIMDFPLKSAIIFSKNRKPYPYKMMRIRRSESKFFYIGTHPIICKNTNELKSCIQKKNENKSYLEQRYDHSKLYSIDTSLWVGLGLNPLKKMLALLPPHFRLPTKEEWEFAARSGWDIDFATNDNSDYTMGKDKSIICMNHNDKLLKKSNSLDAALSDLVPNRAGLYFMSGGLYEIVSMPNGSYGYKGGAFYEPLEHCRISLTKTDAEIPYCLRLVVSMEDNA